MKRGQGEQFNWIFIIVSGAVILAFFTLFAFRYINLQENRQDVRSIVNLGGVLNTLEKLQVGDKGASIDSNELDSGLRFNYDLELNYQCINNKANLFIGSGEFADYKLQDEILFINSKQRVDSLDMWIVPWRFPFHITNFIYLSDPNINYNLVYDSENRDFVNKLEISRAFNVEIVDINDLEIKDDSRYLFFTNRIPDQNKVFSYLEGKENVKFVYINLNNEETYFFEDGWKGQIKYYGNEMMIGAMFSDSADNYECNVNKGLTKLKDVSSIYLEKAKVLSQVSKNGCNYNIIADQLADFADGNYQNLDKLKSFSKETGCLWVF